MSNINDKIYDVFIAGGGINGVGVARDAAGRGYSVCLCEMNDFASGTSSSSTKLIHGGLRYLEHYKFRLVQESLKEREILLNMAPHIIWPMRFILPHTKGMRPRWFLRLGLAIYDHLGHRKILPGTSNVNFASQKTNSPLKDTFKSGFEYSDCWVDDSRLVILNAVDAASKGASLRNYTKVTNATSSNGLWTISTKNSLNGKVEIVKAKAFVNASGPWVDKVLKESFKVKDSKNVRLVRGSHIVVNKLYEGDKSYICQNKDGRIFFIIPYEDNFTLIGTTDIDHGKSADQVKISEQEKSYICESASSYLKQEITTNDIVWSYSGVRPLYDDGASKAQEATRDYVVSAKEYDYSLMINIFGGKITTYRRLSETILEHIENFLGKRGKPWTENSRLPGGEIKVATLSEFEAKLKNKYSFFTNELIRRLARSYGEISFDIFGDADSLDALGENFGGGLYEAEVQYLINNEWARSSDDILFRRSKLGLILSETEIENLNLFLKKNNTKSQSSENIVPSENKEVLKA
ncbi:glycerol-3-phosphate dehydrogenase [Candidatus Pseudothioglobus sp. Uisw_041]|uniref:glycerol-3-phosphate dehydrogenase n=1 Tax=unclassified Candidatus Pseudothioglobus TaxID=3072908 RepID=UPI003A8773DB